MSEHQRTPTQEPLTVATSVTADDAATVVLSGRLDAVTAPELRAVLAGLPPDGRVHLTVDLTDVAFLDSAGLAVLVRSRRETRLRGGSVTLVSPHSADAMRVLRLTQFDQVFPMRPPSRGVSS